MQILECFRQKGKYVGANFSNAPVWSELASALRALASTSCSSRCASRQGSRVTGGADAASSASAGSKNLAKDNASSQPQEQTAPEQQHAQTDFAVLSAKAEKVETKVETKVAQAAGKVANAALLLPGAAAVSLSMPSSMPSCSGSSAPGAKTKAEGMPVPASAPGAETSAEEQRSSSGRGGRKAKKEGGSKVVAHVMSHAKGALHRVKRKTKCDIEAGAAPAASAGTRMQTRAYSNDNGSQAPADEISPSQMETAKKGCGGAAHRSATNARGERSGRRSEAKRSLGLETNPAEASSAKRRRMTKK